MVVIKCKCQITCCVRCYGSDKRRDIKRLWSCYKSDLYELICECWQYSYSQYQYGQDAFLPRDAMHSTDYVVARCLSVRSSDHRRRRRRHRVVVEDRSVAPVWPRRMAARHRSAGGRWWSWRSWSIQRLRGRPELRTQSRSGRLPSDASTCSLSAWWAGMLGDILATCQKMASRRLLMLSITGRRPVRAATSSHAGILSKWLYISSNFFGIR